MKKYDLIFLFFMCFLAIFIWVRDTAWVSAAEDTLPILIALPIFVWLGWPWQFKKTTQFVDIKWIALSIFLFLLGIALDIAFILAFSWTFLLYCYLSVRTKEHKQFPLSKLLVLPLMAFPWISLDLQQLGWWFRLSSAFVSAKLFTFIGLDVMQDGTFLLVNGLPISIDAACAGLNTLQSMLITGSVVALIFLAKTPLFWPNILLLFFMAWLANTFRIITISFAALIFGPKFAMGQFHTWGGWFVLMTMLIFSWIIFALQEPTVRRSKK